MLRTLSPLAVIATLTFDQTHQQAQAASGTIEFTALSSLIHLKAALGTVRFKPNSK